MYSGSEIHGDGCRGLAPERWEKRMARYTQIGRPIQQVDGWWATHLAAHIGAARAAKRIGLTRGTLAAVIAGFPIAASTEARVREARIRSGRKAA